MLRAVVEKTVKQLSNVGNLEAKRSQQEKVVTLPLNNPLVQLDCCMQTDIMELEKMQQR